MTEIRLDVDRPRPPTFGRLYEAIARTVGLTVRAIQYAKTAHGWHVIVTVRERLDPAFTVALQAALGSDPKRELFNCMRVRQLRKAPAFWRHPDRWNVLFHRKL